MPIPLFLIGAGAVTGTLAGTALGWKLTYEIGDIADDILGNVPEPEQDIKNKYLTQLKLFEYSLGDKFIDKKIYAYYLYALIISQQELLNKLATELNTNSNIEYYKNTFPEWESIINDLNHDVKKTLYRFLCYESLFKSIFDIPYQERDLLQIGEKILPFDMLTESQGNKLITWIINPLFNGWFDLEVSNINVINCSSINILNSEKKFCQAFTIKEFPYPEFMVKEMSEYPDHKESIFDCIRPWVLSNIILRKKQLSKDLLHSWTGIFDIVIEQFTGVKAGYTISGGKKVEELAGTAADFTNKMKKDFNDLRKSLGSLYNNTTSGFTGFGEALKFGAIGLGGVLLINLLSSGRENSNN